jgi:inhibitor of KinA
VSVRVSDIGDACVELTLDARVDEAINQICVAVADAVAGARIPGVRDVVATYHTVAVHLDPLGADREVVVGALRRAAAQAGAGRSDGPSATTHEIPVCYGGEFGPDLADVARFGGCSEEVAIRLHSAPRYRVYMMGFLPGFPYLGIVDPRLALGRLDTPRLRVPAGSIGIAGSQTGVYPQESPGGWRIIGRTWVRPFDPYRAEPLLFRAGDHVQFVPVDAAAYWRGAGE